MPHRPSTLIALAAIALLPGCGRDVHSPQGFRLPDGDVDSGRQAFVSLGCIQCHTVVGDPLPAPDDPRPVVVPLGGDVTRVRNYAQLVTSIMHPSHEIAGANKDAYRDEQGNSLMPDLTQQMTVRQMIDITEYLQIHYKVALPTYPYAPDGAYYPKP